MCHHVIATLLTEPASKINEEEEMEEEVEEEEEEDEETEKC